MTYEELVSLVAQEVTRYNTSASDEHIAIEIDIRGEAEGAFYLELKQGKFVVEPYEYYDRDVLVTATARVILEIARGQLGVEEAYRSGQIHARGDIGKMFRLDRLIQL